MQHVSLPDGADIVTLRLLPLATRFLALGSCRVLAGLGSSASGKTLDWGLGLACVLGCRHILQGWRLKLVGGEGLIICGWDFTGRSWACSNVALGCGRLHEV